MTREQFNWIFGAAAPVLAAFSIWLAFKFPDCQPLGKAVVGAWALAPPLFFWLDWVWFCRNMDAQEREIAKHTHDLSRNIRVALVGILAVLFGVGLKI